jgi:hypothetical protein
MRIPYAARFASVAFLVAALYTWLQMQPGLDMGRDFSARQNWILNHALQWSLGWWLWLIAVFSWMLLLVVLGWSYLPAHRVAGSIQSGLMIISAVLAIAGINIWMGVLPIVFAQAELANQLIYLVDAFARTLLGSGLLMGGATTVWIAFDLIRQNLLSRPWLLLVMVSGLYLVLAAFLQFTTYLLLIGLLFWLLPCLWLSTRQRLPSPFPTWQSHSIVK